MKKLVIAVDFDGTLVRHEYPEIGPIIEETFNCIKQVKEKGHSIILWTCREGKELQDAIDFCRENGLEFDAVNQNAPLVELKGECGTRKVFAHYYLDDRGISPTEPLDMNFLFSLEKVGQDDSV